jgi:hypothetical protein
MIQGHLVLAPVAAIARCRADSDGPRRDLSWSYGIACRRAAVGVVDHGPRAGDFHVDVAHSADQEVALFADRRIE